MEQRSGLAYAIAASLDGLDLVVKPFNEAAGNTVRKVVEDQIPVVGERLYERTERGDSGLLDFLDPARQSMFSLFGSLSLVEDGRQLLAQGVSAMQIRCMLEQPSQSFAFVVFQVLMVLAQEPESPFAVLGVGLFGQCLFEPFDLLLAQSVKVVSVLLSNMKSVDDQAGGDIIVSSDVFFNGIQVTFPHIGGEELDRWA